jgi:hypothetical protein
MRRAGSNAVQAPHLHRLLLCRLPVCRALSDKDRKWVAAIAAKLGELLQ